MPVPESWKQPSETILTLSIQSRAVRVAKDNNPAFYILKVKSPPVVWSTISLQILNNYTTIHRRNRCPIRDKMPPLLFQNWTCTARSHKFVKSDDIHYP